MYKLVVLSCLLALAVANPVAPWGLASPLGLGWSGPLGFAGPAGYGHLGLAAPIAAAPYHGVAVAAAPVHAAYNYRGPLSLAPGQPANILAADGRPLDTLSVNLDRAAHITAKAVSGHYLKKRSAPLYAPLAVSHTARIDLPTRVVAAPGWAGWAAPYGVAAAPFGVAAAPYGVAAAPWGLGYGHHGLGLGHGW